MKPAGPVFRKDLAPINIAGLELRDGGVTAIGTAEGGAYAETAFGEIQSVAHGAAHAIVGNPAHVFLADAALQHEIFYQPADGIVGEGGHDSRVETKTTFQSAGHVVFATAFPRAEVSSGSDALVARIEAKHDFAEAHQVPDAGTLRFDLQRRHGVRCSWMVLPKCATDRPPASTMLPPDTSPRQ